MFFIQPHGSLMFAAHDLEAGDQGRNFIQRQGLNQVKDAVNPVANMGLAGMGLDMDVTCRQLDGLGQQPVNEQDPVLLQLRRWGATSSRKNISRLKKFPDSALNV
jgi:hypothetical protein